MTVSYMSELCGNMKPGDIAVMDRAHVDYIQLNTLTEKGVFWVTRSKSNMKVKVIRSRVNDSRNEIRKDKKAHYPIILRDDEVELTGKVSYARYPERFRHFFTLMKGALWAKRSVNLIVSRYGTAGSAERFFPPNF